MWIVQCQKFCCKGVYWGPNLVQFIKIGVPRGVARECKFHKIAQKRFCGNLLVIAGYSPKAKFCEQ